MSSASSGSGAPRASRGRTLPRFHKHFPISWKPRDRPGRHQENRQANKSVPVPSTSVVHPIRVRCTQGKPAKTKKHSGVILRASVRPNTFQFRVRYPGPRGFDSRSRFEFRRIHGPPNASPLAFAVVQLSVTCITVMVKPQTFNVSNS